MLVTPKCAERKCRHLRGVWQKDGTELTEVPVCKAFPSGIPRNIAYGDNPHTEPVMGDRGIHFEEGEALDEPDFDDFVPGT
jgi:hypothetical protein